MKKTTYSLIAIFLTLINQPTLAANVASVSEVNFTQYGKEDAYWVVTVTCDNQSKHIVQQKTDQDRWCPKGSNDFCSEDKNTAFDNVCSDAYADTNQVKVVEQKKTQTTVTPQSREAKEKALVEKRIRDAEQRIQQRIFAEERLASIGEEIRVLDEREQTIQQRLIFINEIIKSEEEEDE